MIKLEKKQVKIISILIAVVFDSMLFVFPLMHFFGLF